MEDTDPELRSHLCFMLRACGDVLITGLGLGCVLRGLQANPLVRSITVVERDADVIKLVWPHTPHDRTELVCDDALQWIKAQTRQWTCAWHDIWTDTGSGEESLVVAHAALLAESNSRVLAQGAWNFPRHIRRLYELNGVTSVEMAG